ncbi:MAG: cation:proton antiporter [Elusimicrobia bacterium]|nr:cation:proton antiporter [Elusimicrobiota bacterium]
MIEQLTHSLTKISIPHLNILFLLGLALFGGTMGGRLFQKLRIPQVVGYIAMGIIIGESGLKIVGHDTIQALQPFSYFALGLIGFMIGGELKKSILIKYGKQFVSILLFEGITAFLAVSVLVGIAGTFLFKNWRFAWSLGLLLGAISSATAPAATTDVLVEYKARGPLTRTLLGIVAMDDGLALLLFAVASSIAGSLMGNIHKGIWKLFISPVYEIGVSLIIGIVSGLILSRILKRYTVRSRLLTFSIGMIFIVLGVALTVHADMLLASMTIGVIVVNFIPRKSEEVFKLVEGFTPPIYILFFVLVGAKLNVKNMTIPIVLLVCIYLIGRTAGKMFGANIGARLSGATKSVQKYLPLCLFSQAGVAIGLSILASNYFPGRIGGTILVIITATTLVVQIIGPSFVKMGVTRAGEVGLNITEEDFIHDTKVKDFMDKKVPLIYENMHLDKILNIFHESANLYYPVVDADKKLIGIITVDGIKRIFTETDVSELFLAVDLMEPATVSITPESSIYELKEILVKHHLEYLPVVNDDNKVVGFIERRIVDKTIATKIIKLQKQADLLEESL